MSFLRSSRAAFAFPILLLLTVPAHAAVFQSTTSGNWNSATTWNLNSVPGPGDTVEVQDGHTVMVTTTADAAGNVLFGTLALGAQITISPGAKLTVTNDVNIDADALGTATIDVGAGTLIANGNININEGSTGGGARLKIGTGIAAATNLTFAPVLSQNNVRVEFTGAGSLTLQGSMDSDGTLITAPNSTVTYNSNLSPQTVGNYTYENLTLANTGGGVEATGAITVNDTLALINGTFVVRNAFNAGASSTLQMSSGTMLKLGDATTTYNVSLPDFATYSLATGSTIFYGANASQTINEAPYKNLTVAYLGSISWTKQFAGNTTVAGDLNIDQQAPGSVILDLSNATVTVAGSVTGDGGLSFSAGGELRIGSDFSNTGAFSAGSGTVTFNGGQFQNVRTVAYNDLYITGTNTNATLVTNGGSAVTLTVDPDSFFDLTSTFTVSGSIVVDGTVNGTGDTLTLSASAGQIQGTGAIYAHVVSGTRSIGSPAVIKFGGNFTINASSTITNEGQVTMLNSLDGSGATWINAANSTLNIAGNVMPSGTLNASASPNLVNYNGLGQTVAAATYHHLTLTTTPVATPGLKTMPATPLLINGEFNLAGSANVTANASLDIGSHFNMGDNSTFAAGSFTHYVAGDFLKSGGTFTPNTSTFTFDGNVAQSIGGSNFHSVTFDNTAAKSINGPLDLSGDFTILTGAIVNGGAQTINVEGDWNDNGVTFNPNSSHVILDGSNGATINSGTFEELTVAKTGSGSAALSGSVSVNTDFTLQSGTFSVGSETLTVGRDFDVQTGSTFDLGSGTVNVERHLSTNGTLVEGTGTLVVNGPTGIQNWTGAGAGVHNLTLNKTSGSLNPSLDLTVSGFLTLTNGVIVTGANKLNVTSGQIFRTNGYIDGALDVTHSSSGAKLYPLGTTYGYAPMSVTIPGAGQLQVSINGGPQPNNQSGGTGLLQMYWTIGPGTVAAPVDLQFVWPVSAVNGTESNYVVGTYAAGWTQPSSTVSDTTHTGAAGLLPSFHGDWTVGEPAAFATSYDLEITTDGNATAGAVETITITAKDGLGNTLTSYSGDHTLIFAGATVSPTGNEPTAKDKNNIAQNFGDNTVVTFTGGVATVDLVFYTNESVSLYASETSASVTGTQASITVAAGLPTLLAVSDVNSGNTLYANAPFTLSISATDGYGNPSNVVSNTTIVVSTSGCGSCTGTLAGSLTLQIPSGNTTANFSDLTYSAAEAGVIFSASATTGDTLMSVNSPATTFVPQMAGVTVTSAANSGAGTLREAINLANSGACGTPCNITFDIVPAGPHTFQLTNRLPSITVPVVIDGNTQDGFVSDPLLTIDGALFTGSNAFDLDGGNSTIRGFNLQNLMSSAITLDSDFNTVQNCWIGTDVTGTTAEPNSNGIKVTGNNNIIGGNVAGARNVISGNTVGIMFSGSASSNVVRGNYIGTDAAGDSAVPNATGISVLDDSLNNTIGGGSPSDRNVISGNLGAGVLLSGGAAPPSLRRGDLAADVAGAVGNTLITSNYIGVAADGVSVLGNVTGVELSDDADATQVTNNVISGNAVAILISNPTVTNTTINSNVIGIGGDGTTPAANVNAAVLISNSSGHTVSNNVIANNGGAGINITGTGTGNVITGNSIPSFGSLPIDLGGDGADTQDAGDNDTGPNNKQNFPVINSAVVNGANLDVTLTINSSLAGAAALQVELFEANASAAPLNSLGTACFELNALTSEPMSVPIGTVVTGDKIVAIATSYSDTCTTPLDGSSEISAGILAACVPPVVSISGPASTCPATPVTLDAGAGFATYSWSTGATTRTITVTPAATETYTVTVTNGTGCPNSDSHTVTLNSSPTVTITGPTTACDTAVLDAGPFATYLWTTGATTRTITVTTGGTYGVTVTDANGCTGTDSHAVTINTTPDNAVSVSGPTTFCAGGSVTLTASTAATYLWSTGATTQAITVNASGAYSVQTSNGSCSGTSAPVNVTVNPAATVTIIGPSSACDSATLDAGPGASWLWSNGDTTRTITVTTSGNYSVTVVDANGCSASDSHTITIDTTPGNAVTATGPTTFCAGGSVTLTASNAASYLWSTGATTQAITVNASGAYSVQTSNGSCTVTSTPVNVTVNPAATVTIIGPSSACDSATLDAGPGASWLWSTGDTTRTITVTASGNYSVTVVDASGCSASDSHTITINTTPAINISGPASACDNATLDAGAGFASYLWSTGATTQTINVTASGTYNVTVTTAGGCTASDSHAITVNNTLTPVINGPATACGNATLDAGAGFTSYLWSTGETTQTINVTTGGTYNVTVTGANGCSGSDAHTITINSASPATITPNGATTFCAGSDVTLTASAGASYLWSNGATTPSITVASSGTFSVTITDGSGCTSTSAPVTVTVTAAPVVTIAGPASTCTGTPVTLDAGAGFASYLWSNGATTQTITFTPTGTETRSVTVTDGSNCTATDSHTVTLASNPTATIAAPQTVCASATNQTASVAAQAGATYAWTISGGTITSATDSDSITFKAASTGNVILGVTITNGSCTSNGSVQIPINPAPSASITAPASVNANATNLNASVPFQNGATYTWSALNGLITAGQGTNSITFKAGSSGTTKLTVNVTLDGCTASANKTISIISTTPLEADLAIVKTAPSSIQAGTPLTYTLTVTNHGPNNASDVTITDHLPANVSVSAIDKGSWSCSEFSAGVFCTGSLAAGASSSVSITVNAPQQAGLLVNTASVVAGISDPVSANNQSSASTNVIAAPSNCSTVPPSLLTPANNATVTSPVTFSWTAVEGATEYEVWLANANGTFLAGTTATTSLSKALPAETDQWYVVARFAGDCTPLVSAQRTFTVSESGNCTNVVAPQVTAPAAGSTTGTSVTFAWTPVPGAIGYRVWVESNGTAAQDLGTTNGAITLTANVPTGALTVYVDALFSGCPAARSTAVAFNVPAPDPCANRNAPATLSPANDSTVNSSLVNFTWSAATNATGYRVWFAVDNAAPSALGDTTETSLTATIPNGTITWWVEALYDGCSSLESQRARFTVPRRNDCSTARPELIAPANNSTTSNGSVTFNWNSVPNAIGYELWLSIDDGTPTLLATTTSTSATQIVPAGRISWFVRALVDRCPSRDSLLSRFTFTPSNACAANQRPVATAPLTNGKVTSPVSFSWTASAGATSYEVFAIRGNQTQLIATTNTNQATDIAMANGRLRWFVRAHFGNDCVPLDSTEEKLEVVPAPAACATMSAPEIAAVGQISSGVPFTIQWTSIAAATSYQLQLASDSKFTNAQLISTNDTQHALTRTNVGATPLTLYARVRAIDTRCKPEANVTPYGAASAIYILPLQGSDAAAPVEGGVVTYNIPLGSEFAGQSFTATSNQSWITIVPSSGIVPQNGLPLVVTANTTNLPLGTSMSAIRINLAAPAAAGSIGANATTLILPTVGVSKATPVDPNPKSTPPPDALIIPAVAHADGMNSKFQSDVRVTNTSAKLMQYQITFTPSGGNGLAGGKKTTFGIEPGRTIALDDVLRTWFGTGGESSIGTLEIRPLTQSASAMPAIPIRGLSNLVTFASSRTFNVTANGTFGQYIPAVPFGSFIGRAGELASSTSLSLQQIAQSARYRTNLGIVEASGEPASLLVKVFGDAGQQLTQFPVQLKGGEHTQLNGFLAANGISSLNDGRVEVSVIGGGGKVTAYASVLDNETNDPLLVTPVMLTDDGSSKWVMPGVADLNNGAANWQTDMRVFNGGTEDVTARLTFYSQAGGEPKTADITIPAGQVRQFDRTLSSVFGISNDGGAVHISTPSAARLVATARTYNQTSAGTYGQFISAVTPTEAAGTDTRALELLQVEESSRFRSNLGLAEVTGNPVTIQLAVVTPDTKTTAFTELTLAPNEFRQFPAILRSVGLTDTFNARVSIRVIGGTGRVTAYASVIDQLTNDPTYVPAQ